MILLPKGEDNHPMPTNIPTTPTWHSILLYRPHFPYLCITLFLLWVAVPFFNFSIPLSLCTLFVCVRARALSLSLYSLFIYPVSPSPFQIKKHGSFAHPIIKMPKTGTRNEHNFDVI